jgi:hypothetical protein
VLLSPLRNLSSRKPGAEVHELRDKNQRPKIKMTKQNAKICSARLQPRARGVLQDIKRSHYKNLRGEHFPKCLKLNEKSKLNSLITKRLLREAAVEDSDRVIRPFHRLQSMPWLLFQLAIALFNS